MRLGKPRILIRQGDEIIDQICVVKHDKNGVVWKGAFPLSEPVFIQGLIEVTTDLFGNILANAGGIIKSSTGSDSELEAEIDKFIANLLGTDVHTITTLAAMPTARRAEIIKVAMKSNDGARARIMGNAEEYIESVLEGNSILSANLRACGMNSFKANANTQSDIQAVITAMQIRYIESAMTEESGEDILLSALLLEEIESQIQHNGDVDVDIIGGDISNGVVDIEGNTDIEATISTKRLMTLGDYVSTQLKDIDEETLDYVALH